MRVFLHAYTVRHYLPLNVPHHLGYSKTPTKTDLSVWGAEDGPWINILRVDEMFSCDWFLFLVK
jgi:hypothetical protein